MKFNEINFAMLDIERKKQINYKNIIIIVFSLIIIVVSIYLIISANAKENQTEDVKTANEEEITMVILDEKPQEIQLPVFNEDINNQIKGIYKSDVKRVFLTFDDGPSQTVTPLILDTLKQNNIKATFFVLGSRVELYPEILKRAYNEGHFIANHGYSHKYEKIYAQVNNVIGEFNQTEECIRNALGIPEYSSHLFRFPGGSNGGKYANLKKQAIKVLEENQIAYLDWNCLTRDAEGNFNKEQLYENVLNTAQNKNSVVVLMHDAGTKTSTAEALQSIIDYFKENKYEFMNLYDIMK